jgi:hypothetical protein
MVVAPFGIDMVEMTRGDEVRDWITAYADEAAVSTDEETAREKAQVILLNRPELHNQKIARIAVRRASEDLSDTGSLV